MRSAAGSLRLSEGEESGSASCVGQPSAHVIPGGVRGLSASPARMWAPMSTLAPSSLRADLYPHSSAAFTTEHQLAGAFDGGGLVRAFGEVRYHLFFTAPYVGAPAGRRP